ncbi:MAG: alginate O-acetyltransferase complex protein AlgJ [Gammaproteobacteria bacterium]|jgi:alginate O-acetyltransferase complex protein AlgJ
MTDSLPNKRHTSSKTSGLLMSLVVMIILLLPVSGFIGALGIDDVKRENRSAAHFPTLSTSPLDIIAFPKLFSGWWSDHMGFRQPLIDASTQITSLWLDSPDKVIAGKENWLFLYKTSIRPDLFSVFSDYCGRVPFTSKELKHFGETLNHNWTMFKQKGIDYRLILIPNKHSLYSKHFPARIQCEAGTQRYDQLVAYLLDIPDFPLIDFKPLLQKHLDSHLWLKRDTHWNGRAVALAVDDLLEQLNAEDLVNRKTLEQAVVTSTVKSGDLITLSRQPGKPYKDSHFQWIDSHLRQGETKIPIVIPWSKYQPLVFNNSVQATGKLLAVHDSFFAVHDMQKLLASLNHRAVFVRRPGHFDLSYLVPLIDAEQPDTIIQQFVERKLLWPEPGLLKN